MSAAPPRIQPRGVAALAHYVEMRTKQPMLNLGLSVHSIHLGTEYAAEIDFFDIADAVNNHASLKARAEQAERAVDVLESDARVQAKLLADTGRRVEELEGALLEVNGCFEAAYAEGLSERLAEADQDTGTLADLFYRRIVFAHHAGIAALSPKPSGETD